MIDWPTATVLASSILGLVGVVITAMIQYLPRKERPSRIENADMYTRLSSLESRVAVAEANYGNLSGLLQAIQKEIHEIRSLLMRREK